VQRVRGGDRESYAHLVRRHQDTLYRHARGMGLDHDNALDLVQDTLVKGLTHIDECTDGARFRAWLARIGRNLCLDYLKNVRRATVPLSHAPQAENVGRASPVDDALTLYEVLNALPDSMREVFLLKHDAGYSYEEIAEITGAGVSAVKMRVHRARETLREKLDVTSSAA